MPDPNRHLEHAPLQVSVHPDGPDGVLVRARGDLDVSAVQLIREVLEAAVTAGVHRVAVDVSELTFLDAAGLRAMLGPRTPTGDQAQLVLRAPSRPARRAIELAGLAALIEAGPPHPYLDRGGAAAD